jgi:hypothetical protein
MQITDSYFDNKKKKKETIVWYILILFSMCQKHLDVCSFYLLIEYSKEVC